MEGRSFTRALTAAVAGFVLIVTLFAGVAAAGAATLFGAGSALVPTRTALAAIPDDYLTLYMRAAATCRGLPWTVLAAIGHIESRHGRNTGPSSAGARGPMQFLPSTWDAYGIDGDSDGRADIHNRADAIHAAAGYLCDHGARGGHDIPGAVYAYNHSPRYVDQVLDLAATLAAPAAGSAAAQQAIAYARAQLGKPYEWGAEGPHTFDCSGLVMRAYQSAGITLPRTTYPQWAAGPRVPPGQPLLPGDLVFFRAGPRGPEHVGLYIGDGRMINAPHTGAQVRIDSIDRPSYLGATRPAAHGQTPT